MVEPVAGSAGPYDSLELVRFHPNNFVHPLVAPQLEAFSAQLHGATGDPQEYQAFVLR